MNQKSESQRMATGRNVSIVEGFVQTIGITMGGIYFPNFILTAFLLDIMHASPILIGFATSIQFIVGLLQPLANILARGVKSRRIMVTITSTISRLLFAGAIFWGMYNSGPGAETVFMVILLVGAFFMSFAGSGWSTWMADLVSESGRGRYFALRNSICSVAGILAVLLGGWLLKNLPGAGGFAAIYAICAAAGLIGGVILLLQHEPPRVEQVSGSLAKNYGEIFKDRNFMSFVVMVIFFNLAIVLASPFFNVHFLKNLNIPTETLAWFTALAALTGILGNIFFGKLSDVVGNRLIIRICLLLLIIPTVLVIFIPGAPVNFLWLDIPPQAFVLLVILLQSFLMAGWNLATFNTSLSISPRNQRSFYIGIYNSLIAVSAVIAPLIGGILINLFKDSSVALLGQTLPTTFPVFAISAVLLLIGLIAFPAYREGGHSEDYSLRDVVLRLDFPEIIYKLFVSTFIPRIGARHKLAEDISELRSPAAVIPLGRLLRDTDPDIRMSALEGLGRTGAQGALEVLLEFFPQAGVLEKVELMKSIGNFANDDRVLRILIAETKSPFPTLRIRALHSLRGACANPEILQLATVKLHQDLDSLSHGNPSILVDEEYLAYLELVCLSKNLGGVTVSRQRYLSLTDPVWRLRFLHSWSHALDIHNQFYRYLSLDQAQDQIAMVEEARVASIETLVRCPAVHEVHNYLKRQAAEFRQNAQGFFTTCEKILGQALAARPPEVSDLVLWLLHKADRTESEEILMLMTIRRHTLKIQH